MTRHRAGHQPPHVLNEMAGSVDGLNSARWYQSVIHSRWLFNLGRSRSGRAKPDTGWVTLNPSTVNRLILGDAIRRRIAKVRQPWLGIDAKFALGPRAEMTLGPHDRGSARRSG
jgi:hypothetical protein